MTVEPAPNTTARPYRCLSVQEVDIPLDEGSIRALLLPREVYRRTDYIVLRRGQQTALVRVTRSEGTGLFVPIVDVQLISGPGHTVWLDAPQVDVGNATALARAALSADAPPEARAYVIRGLYQHVNFIWRPAPLAIRVFEVVPPEPAKLFEMARQAVAFDEDLPPIDLRLDAIDFADLAEARPSSSYLLPCKGSEVSLHGDVKFLDTRPETRGDWTLIGCRRSLQFHRHFYGDEPPRVDICPRERIGSTDELTLAKCCLLERGVEYPGGAAVVPWGATLDEVRQALRRLTGVELEHAEGADT